jgi:hypothetical protein
VILSMQYILSSALLISASASWNTKSFKRVPLQLIACSL